MRRLVALLLLLALASKASAQISLNPTGVAASVGPVNINSEQNVASPTYGANPRTSAVVSTTAVTNGTTAVTLGAADGFINGEGIAIYGAGASPTLGASVTPTVTQTGYTGANSGTVVTYVYQISACDANYACKAASAASVSVSGPSVLSHENTANGTGAGGTGGNYNTLTGYSVASAVHYVIWRNKASAGNLLWAVTDLTTFKDFANIQTMSITTGPFNNTPLAADTAGVFASTIASGAGTTSVVLAAAPTQTGTFTAWPDATSAIQTAANSLGTNGGKVYMPVGFYKVRTIQPPTRVIFYGAGGARSSSVKTLLQGTSGYDVFAWTGSQVANDIAFRDFAISGGRNAFFDSSTAAITNLTMEHLTAAAYDYAGIECAKCPMEEWWTWDTYWANGWYGYDLEGDGSGTNYINKSHFTDTQYASQAVNAIRMFKNFNANGGVTWLRANVTGVRQDGIYMFAPISSGGIDFNGWNDEGIGVDFSKATTTATCTSGNNVVVVTSATGLAIGQNYIVMGCGTASDVLEGTICAIAGSNITLQDPTCTTATNAGTTQTTPQYSSNAIFDNFYSQPSSGTLSQLSIQNGNFTDVGGCCGSAQTRFQVFAKSGANLINVAGARVEDPSGVDNIFPGISSTIGLSRQTPAGSLFTAGQLEFSSGTNPGTTTTMTSPPGGTFNLGMVDSANNGTGTYSHFTIWNNRAAGRQKSFDLDPSNGGAAALAGSLTVGGSFASGHLAGAGIKPTVLLNGCGTIAAGNVTSGSDLHGTETVGTTTTSCVIQFGTAYAVAPQCFCSDVTTPANVAFGACTATTAALTIPMTSNTGNVVQWACFGN